MRRYSTILFLLLAFVCNAQTAWWGAAVGLGHNQPYQDQSAFNLLTQDANNQLVPLFLSSQGEYMWCDKAFGFEVNNGQIITSEAMTCERAGDILRSTTCATLDPYCPTSGRLPVTLV